MQADIEKLKALALAAPEGPWTFGSKYVAKPEDGYYSYIAQCPDGTEDTPAWEAAARFIAAANPAAVLELTGEIDSLKLQLERLKIERDTFRHGHRLASDRVCDLEAEVERLRAEKRPKDHNIRQLVNDLRNIALKFHAAGQLRERISGAVGQFIDASYSIAPRCRAEGGGTSAEKENPAVQKSAEGGAVLASSVSRSAPAAGTEKDAERLDFMIQHEARIGWSQDGEHCRVLRRDADGDEVPMLGWGARHWRVGARDAIDAAIGARTKAGTEPA